MFDSYRSAAIVVNTLRRRCWSPAMRDQRPQAVAHLKDEFLRPFRIRLKPNLSSKR